MSAWYAFLKLITFQRRAWEGSAVAVPKKVEALNPEAKAFLETRTVNYVPEQSW